MTESEKYILSQRELIHSLIKDKERLERELKGKSFFAKLRKKLGLSSLLPSHSDTSHFSFLGDDVYRNLKVTDRVVGQVDVTNCYADVETALGEETLPIKTLFLNRGFRVYGAIATIGEHQIFCHTEDIKALYVKDLQQ